MTGCTPLASELGVANYSRVLKNVAIIVLAVIVQHGLESSEQKLANTTNTGHLG